MSNSQAVNMAHFAGINKGPVLDWTDDNGLMECYCKWRKKVEVLKGPLNNANDPVKCNYIIYWSGDTGMELVEKWEIEGKSMMETGTTSTGILNFSKNILLPSQMLS